MSENEMTGSIRRALSRGDRFDNYREITARFAGTGLCGHPIAKGDRIGFNRRHGTRCAECWRKWVAENAAAAADEAFLSGGW